MKKLIWKPGWSETAYPIESFRYGGAEGTYREGGHPALILETEEGKITASVNFPAENLPEDVVAIKNWSENEGMLEFLIEAGIVSDPIDYIESGYVKAPVVRVLARSMSELPVPRSSPRVKGKKPNAIKPNLLSDYPELEGAVSHEFGVDPIKDEKEANDYPETAEGMHEVRPDAGSILDDLANDLMKFPVKKWKLMEKLQNLEAQGGKLNAEIDRLLAEGKTPQQVKQYIAKNFVGVDITNPVSLFLSKGTARSYINFKRIASYK